MILKNKKSTELYNEFNKKKYEFLKKKENRYKNKNKKRTRKINKINKNKLLINNIKDNKSTKFIELNDNLESGEISRNEQSDTNFSEDS